MSQNSRTTRDIVEAIGRDRFEEMLDVGSKSVARALTLNKFTASWYDAICKELETLGQQPPDRALFTFKEWVK